MADGNHKNNLREAGMGERLGFIGLGNMGKPMAVNLVRAGVDLTVFDRDPAPVAGRRSGGAWSESGRFGG